MLSSQRNILRSSAFSMTSNSTNNLPVTLFGERLISNGLSVVTPMYNEEGGAASLIVEINKALVTMVDVETEIIVVDDGSTDETRAELHKIREDGVNVRIIAHGTNAGQSRAIRSGVLGAKYDLIAMIDGDGQNDPVDIPAMYALLREGDFEMAMVAGERKKRLDRSSKRIASKFANTIRQKLLNDGARDSGCGLKLFRREAFLRLPYFDHLHRYLPFMMQREGLKVSFYPVHHRARSHGSSKYTNMGRLVVAFRDLAGVMWLKSRAKSPKSIIEE